MISSLLERRDWLEVGGQYCRVLEVLDAILVSGHMIAENHDCLLDLAIVIIQLQNRLEHCLHFGVHLLHALLEDLDLEH